LKHNGGIKPPGLFDVVKKRVEFWDAFRGYPDFSYAALASKLIKLGDHLVL